jgi:hypothetical protein
MSSSSRSNLHVILIAVMVAIAPLAMYSGAYFGLTSVTTRSNTGEICRVYRSQSMALIFLPACLLESLITGRETHPAWRDPTVGPGPNGS